jgi:anti-sigma factor RsiW
MTRDLTAEEIEQYADGELTSDAAREHVHECARCAAAVLDVMQMKRAIGRLPRYTRTKESRGWLSSTGPWLAAAAVVALVILGSYLTAARTAARELVDLHTTIVGSASPIEVVSTDKHTVKPWFEGRVPFAVDVPDLQSTDFRLAGGRVVFWRGEPVAYMLITKGAHRVSVFVSQARITPRFSVMTIESWTRNGLMYTAVGDLPRDDLRRLRDAFLRQP